MKIATWNINSLKVRLPQVLDWLTTQRPDVLALQETKCTDDCFPVDAIREAGYHAVWSGQKTYNGVATLSKAPARDIERDVPGLDDLQRRMLTATIEDVRIVNLYVPNGERVDSPKYLYKLEWLRHLSAYLRAELALHPPLVVLGDFNIAPDERDVYDPAFWEGQVLFSASEREAFLRLLALGLHDSFRLFEQPPGAYSWWDYRAGAFRRNLGLRIDHILISEILRPRARAATIDREARRAERPSDHAPVVLELG